MRKTDIEQMDNIKNEYYIYDVMALNGGEFILIVDKQEKGYCAILDSEFNLVDGAIDSYIVDKLGINDLYCN